MNVNLLPYSSIQTALLLFLCVPLSFAYDDREKESKQQVEFGIDVAQRGLWQEAVYRWEKAVELDPKNASARNNLAVAYEQEGKFELANEEYEKALEIDSNNLYILQNYELFMEAYERKKRSEQRSSRN